jgi:hypothetical protein
MTTFILNAETAKLSIEHLLNQAKSDEIEVRNSQGELLAYVVSPNVRDAWIYAEANRDIDQNIEQVRAALARRGGITTAELLKKAAALTANDASNS